jgi:ribosomal protein S12 methylthiotransferase accessory factor
MSAEGTATEEVVPKRFRRGTHRAIAPAETLRRVSGFFGQMGITRIANLTGLDRIGIPVVQVCRPNGRSLSVSQGKGLDLDAAKASGVMEAIELHHAEQIEQPLKLGSWRELGASHPMVRVEGLPRTSLSLFHQDQTLLWIEGVDRVSGAPTWVPFETVHMNFTPPLPTGSGCFAAGSNGLASGNHQLEAICHAICELIERDAQTLFRCESEEEREARRVDAETVVDADARTLLDAYERAGVSVSIWDVTSDLGVPVFRCCVADRDMNPFSPSAILEGSGCHLVPEIALARALTEAAQARLTLIAGSRDDVGWQRHGAERSRAADEVARANVLRKGMRRFPTVPTSALLTFEEDERALLDALRTAGLDQVVAVDLTRSEFGVPVVRVIIPGLETHHGVAGFVPGRRARRLLARRLGGQAG